METQFDFHDALIRIEMIFQSHILSFGYKEYSLETFADKKYFSEWKGREGCIDTDAMRKGLNIDGILGSAEPSENEVLTYLQYTVNIAELCRRSFNREDHQGYHFDIRNYTELLTSIRQVLDVLHYAIRFIPERDFIYLIPQDPAAEALLENENNPEAAALAEYRSFSLQGKPEEKRLLLKKLASGIEEFADNLNPENEKLYRRIEFMMNRLHIREELSFEEAAEQQDMKAEELENWYDTTYQLMLLRILGHNSEEEIRKVSEFARESGIEGLGIDEGEALPYASGKRLTGENIDSPETASVNANSSSAASESGDADVSSGEETGESESPQREEAAKPPSSGRSYRNVIIAIVIADIIFMLILAFYLLG